MLCVSTFTISNNNNKKTGIIWSFISNSQNHKNHALKLCRVVLKELQREDFMFSLGSNPPGVCNQSLGVVLLMMQKVGSTTRPSFQFHVYPSMAGSVLHLWVAPLSQVGRSGEGIPEVRVFPRFHLIYWEGDSQLNWNLPICSHCSDCYCLCPECLPSSYCRCHPWPPGSYSLLDQKVGKEGRKRSWNWPSFFLISSLITLCFLK